MSEHKKKYIEREYISGFLSRKGEKYFIENVAIARDSNSLNNIFVGGYYCLKDVK